MAEIKQQNKTNNSSLDGRDKPIIAPAQVEDCSENGDANRKPHCDVVNWWWYVSYDDAYTNASVLTITMRRKVKTLGETTWKDR
ncbi:hypothetical protein T265_04797 [Opisthorchis viverrini]|uniref:Uncharacterized protein n=1 Tax=Opisthorchis viverrini TaxID=6198 RepID=A0A074ZLU5_OPIVI|nr:hypothetical protein T265_04797 [Opisthorchis viverrini]KER28338.1 hypothetical protein T265_04797 [Opisthorchis viverrini]